MVRRTALATFVLLTVSTPVVGQYAATQAETLRGLQRVLVVFSEPNERLEALVLRDLYQDATLELRKVGIRVATEAEEVDMSTDGVLNMTVFADGGFSQNVTLRIDVEQHATLVRTGETKQMVTWFYEAARSGYPADQSARVLLTDGVNEFLSDWLDANGR